MRRPLSALGGFFDGLVRFVVRFAIGLVCYPFDLVTTAGRAWYRFFFTPAEPAPLGLLRVSVGLLSLWSLWTIGLDLHANLGSDGWANPEALRAYWNEWKAGAPAWSLWLVVPDRFLAAAWVASLIVVAAFTLGIFSRVTAVLSWIVMVSTVRRAPVLFFGFDQSVLTWLMYLAVSGASGQAFSLDRLLARGHTVEPSVSANLGLRLIQLHLCLIYAVSGLAKLAGSSWWNGEAVLTILVLPEYHVGNLTWLAAYPKLLNLLAHGTVLLEILYPVLIWNRLCRPALLVAMVLLHVAIDQTLGLREFSLSMIAANMAFVSGPWLRGRPIPAAPPTETG